MKKFYLLPGMGATSQIYGEHVRSLEGLQLLEWPSEGYGTSIGSVAEHLIKQNKISPNDVVGGSSLGGMVAAEICNQLGCEKLCLIGSCSHPSYVAAYLRKSHKLAGLLPKELFQLLYSSAGTVSNAIGRKGVVNDDAKFVKTIIPAVFEWSGLKANCDILRIHGRYDKIINVPEKGEIIKGAGHMVAMTNDEKVAALIACWL